MAYLETSKDVTIDELIKTLQKAKKDLGGNAKVLVNHNDDFHSLEIVAADMVEGSYGYYEWTGDPDEDEETGETVLTLYTHN